LGNKVHLSDILPTTDMARIQAHVFSAMSAMTLIGFWVGYLPKWFQGSAESVLVTIHNIAAAIMTAIGNSIGQKASSAAT
jgi:hypothetical protein